MGWAECLVVESAVSWLLVAGAVVVAWLLGYQAGQQR